MLHRLRDLFLGSPLPTYEQAENRLNKIRFLEAFSTDLHYSILYDNQEIYLGLIIDPELLILIIPLEFQETVNV